MIVPVNGSHTGYFYNQPTSLAFRDSSIPVKLTFLLGQAITLNYIGRVYGGRDVSFNPTRIPFLIKDYQAQVHQYCNYTGCDIEDTTMDTETKNRYCEILHLIHELLSPASSIKNTDLLINFLETATKDVPPIPCTSGFYVPYLKYLETTSQDIKGDFTINNIVSVPQFFLKGSLLIEEDIPVGSSYNYSYVGTRKFTEHPHSLGVKSIYSYLRGYNWSNFPAYGVIGLLASYGTLEMNESNIEPGSNMRAFYDVHRLMSLKPSDGSSIPYDSAFEPVLRFLVDICYRFKIKITDRSMLVNFINHTNPDGKLLRDYLSAATATDVSAEAYEAFKRSTLRNLVGLEIMNIIDDTHSTTSLDAAVAPNLVDAKTKRNQPNTDPEEGNDTEQPEDPKGEEPESTSTDSADDTTQSMDQTEQDTTDEDKGVDDAEQQKEESSEEPKSEEVEESDNNNKEYTHTTVPKPKLPGLNLKKGLDMELAPDDEDIDTFLYRKEVESFIDNVLANPNDLSVAQQEALKRIKQQFLYSLNVQSLYNLLKKTVS